MRYLWLLLLTAAAVLQAAPAVSGRTEPLWKTLEKQAVQAQFPDADCVLLYDRQMIRYEADGTSRETDDFYYKVLTEQGVHSLRRQTLQFCESYGNAEFVKAEILRPGKAPVQVDLKSNTSLAVDSSQMDENIYDPRNKVRQLLVPDLQVGDTLHIVTRTQITKSRIPGVWSGFVLLQSTDPVLHYEVHVDAPASCPLRNHSVKDPVTDSVTFEEKQSGERIFYSWTAKNVPQVFPEPLMPPLYSCVQRLLMSTVPDWPSISRWYYKLCLPHLKAVTPAMKAKVEELVRGADSPQEKMRRIFRFVSQEIRYMGITTEEDAPGYEPHDVRVTFERRYGVCRDKAALLTAMLQLAGIRAYPVLFMAGALKDANVPNIYFNHAITAAEPVPGKYVLLDPTYENTVDFLPAGEAEMSYLAATPEGDTLRQSPPADPRQNSIHGKSVIRVRYDGSTDFQTEMSFSGVHDQIFRSAFARWPKDYPRQFFASLLKKLWIGAKLTDLTVEPANIRDTTKPLKIRITGTTGTEMLLHQDRILLKPPNLLQSFVPVSMQLLEEVGLQKRQFPLKLYACSDVNLSYTVMMPEGMVLENQLMPAFSQHTPGVSISYKTSLSGRNLSGNFRMQIAKTRFSPDDYLQFKKLLRDWEPSTRWVYILRRSGVISDPGKSFHQADAIYQKRDRELVMTAPGTGKLTEHYRMIIRNYAGVKRNAELKIPYNPVWAAQPKIQARVTAPDGTIRTLHPEEINVMDQSWVSQAPRYPAGKILVASLPGVKAGSTVEYTLVTEFRDRPAFHFMHVFGARYPILSDELHILWPPDYHPQELPLPSGGVQRKGNNFYCCGSISIWREPGQPALEYFVPSWGFSGFTWKAWATGLQKALLEKTKNQPRAAALAKSLCAGKKTESEKILAIRNYVLHNIRLAGPVFHELPQSCLTPADRVLQEGYGHSADRAILLKTMLDAVGIPARFTAVSDWDYTQKNLQRLEQFPRLDGMETVLVAAGKEVPNTYLNWGTQYDSLWTCAYENRLALDLQDGEWRTLEVRQSGRDLAMQFDMVLQPDGTADIFWQQRYYGEAYGKAAKQFAELTPELRRRYEQNTLAELAQSAELRRPMATQFERYPGVRDISVRIPDYAISTGEYRQIELPFFERLSDAVNTGDSHRVTPYERRRQEKMELTYRIEFPAAWQLQPEADQELEQGMAKMVIRRRVNKNVLYVTAQLELRPGEIEPWDYNDLESLQRMLQLPGLRMVFFKVLTKP